MKQPRFNDRYVFYQNHQEKAKKHYSQLIIRKLFGNRHATTRGTNPSDYYFDKSAQH